LSAASPGDTLSGHLGRTWDAAMSQAALVNGIIFSFVVLLALLLVLFCTQWLWRGRKMPECAPPRLDLAVAHTASQLHAAAAVIHLVVI
jgi:hypothetical protein